jgi:hypothetical protein
MSSNSELPTLSLEDQVRISNTLIELTNRAQVVEADDFRAISSLIPVGSNSIFKGAASPKQGSDVEMINLGIGLNFPLIRRQGGSDIYVLNALAHYEVQVQEIEGESSLFRQIREDQARPLAQRFAAILRIARLATDDYPTHNFLALIPGINVASSGIFSTHWAELHLANRRYYGRTRIEEDKELSWINFRSLFGITDIKLALNPSGRVLRTENLPHELVSTIATFISDLSKYAYSITPEKIKEFQEKPLFPQSQA